MRISVFEFDKKVPMDVQEALENIRLLLNNGKYVPRVVTTEPTYTGEIGEDLIFISGPTNAYRFTYTQYGWFYVAMTLGPLP